MPQVPYSLEEAEEDIADLRGQLSYLAEVGSALNLNLASTSGAFFPATTVTAASLTAIATTTITANDPGLGAVYELEVWGYGTQGSSDQTLEFGVSLGGTAMASITFGTSAFTGTGEIFRFRVTGRVICNTTGTGGTWTSYMDGVVSQFNANLSASNSNMAAGFSCESTGTTTKSTAADQTFAVQAAWGATTGSPTLTSQVALFKRIA